MLTEENLKIALNYSLSGETALKDKDEDYKNLLISYISDKNSSTIRENITLMYCNYIKYESKHGADGYCPISNRKKEVKPSYVSEGKKLGSSGNFNDLTVKLLETKMDYDIIDSVFYLGRLVYIVEFPLMDIYEKLLQPIKNARAGKRVVSHFNYNNYRNSNIKVHYYNELFADYALSKGHKLFMKGLIDDNSSKFFKYQT